MVCLIQEGSVFLVAFGGEADVVELNFIRAGLGHEFGESDIEILHFGLRGIGPDQLAVFAPGLLGFLGLDCEFGMFDDHALVAEYGDAGDGVHVLGMQEVDELWKVADIDLVLAEERVLEGNVDAAVGVFDIEDDGVAADLAPAADDAKSVVAGGHDAGEVDGADFKIFGDGNGFFHDGRGKNPRDGDLVAGSYYVVGAIAVDFADGFGEFGRREI